MEKTGKRPTSAVRDLQKRYERRDIMITSRGGRCEWCRIKYPNWMYDFHHLVPSNKNMVLGLGNLGRKWKIIEEEFKKCVVLCPNCHRSAHAKLKGWIMREMLIDGDVIVYKACYAVQRETDWGDGVVTPSTNLG